MKSRASFPSINSTKHESFGTFEWFIAEQPTAQADIVLRLHPRHNGKKRPQQRREEIVKQTAIYHFHVQTFFSSPTTRHEQRQRFPFEILVASIQIPAIWIGFSTFVGEDYWDFWWWKKSGGKAINWTLMLKVFQKKMSRIRVYRFTRHFNGIF